MSDKNDELIAAKFCHTFFNVLYNRLFILFSGCFNNFWNLASNSFLQLVFIFVLSFYIHDKLSEYWIRFFFTVSTFLRECLIFLLPFLIFSFISIAISSVKKVSIIYYLVIAVFISSIFHICMSCFVNFAIFLDAKTHVLNKTAEIKPLIDFNFFKITDNNMMALFVGICAGIYNAKYNNKYVNLVIHTMSDIIKKIMNNFFIPMLPLFIMGFLLKLLAEGRVYEIFNINLYCFLRLLLYLFLYFCFLMFVICGSLNRMLEFIKNTYCALIMAFTTSSSAIAFPLSLKASKLNTRDNILVDAIMPFTLCFHIIGDIMLIPFTCMIVTLAFNNPLPNIDSFFIFIAFCLLSQFAVAGLPNATIIVITPILKKYLGFDDVMIAFTVGLYVFIEPFATLVNVLANNVFIIFFQKALNKFRLEL